MDYVKKWIDSVTMYRMVTYALVGYTAWALVLTVLGVFSFTLTAFVLSLLVVLVVSTFTHYVFTYLYDAPSNYESTLISALIIFLLFTPQDNGEGLAIIAFASFVMVVSKYIIAWRKLHIFNPVAFSLVLVSLLGVGHAIWWVANPYMFIPVLIGGIFITAKIKRFPLVFATVISALIVFATLALWRGTFSVDALLNFFLAWPIIFFATVMVTEPLSTPAGVRLQIAYGAIVGALSSLPYSLGPLYSSPELALLIGNMAFYPTMLKARLVLELKEKNKIAQNAYEYIFSKPQGVNFQAGQYLEWTLPHESKDNRGIRRYLTIASSPTENHLMVGLNIPTDKPSSFKKQLANMTHGDQIYATSLRGDFTLPNNVQNKKIVFIAGGIGVTPFRSMLKYLIDTKTKADITLFYCDDDIQDVIWKDFWKTCIEKIGIQVVYVMNVDDPEWDGERGYITKEILTKYLGGSLQEYLYYISGPPVMVDAYTKLLHKNKVHKENIVTDFFPGL